MQLAIDKNTKAFTLIELIIAILISVMLLWGIFYFMSNTILSISRAAAHSKFLKDFYSFTTIFDTGELEIIHDYPLGDWYDVAILKTLDGDSWVIIWVVDANTLKLSPPESVDTYHQAVLGYRGLSSNEINDVDTNPWLVYDYSFFGDKTFSNFYLRDFQMQMYNSWATMDMTLSIFPDYRDDLYGESWSSIPQDNIFYYSLIF